MLTRVKPAPASCSATAGVMVSGLASVVTSASGARPQRSPTAATRDPRDAAGSMVGVPPPTKTVDTGGAPAPSSTRPAISTSARADRRYPWGAASSSSSGSV